MTKREFHTKYGAPIVELLSNPTLQIALAFLQEECPYLEDKSPDPTSIIRNEGKIQGWNACLKAFKNLYKSEPEPVVTKEGPRYQDPDPRNSEQNRK
jgi:hypothetical protein